MRVTELKQSNTSPLKYHVILNPEEFSLLKSESFLESIKMLQEIRDKEVEKRY